MDKKKYIHIYIYICVDTNIYIYIRKNNTYIYIYIYYNCICNGCTKRLYDTLNRKGWTRRLNETIRRNGQTKRTDEAVAMISARFNNTLRREYFCDVYTAMHCRDNPDVFKHITVVAHCGWARLWKWRSLPFLTRTRFWLRHSGTRLCWGPLISFRASPRRKPAPLVYLIRCNRISWLSVTNRWRWSHSELTWINWDSTSDKPLVQLKVAPDWTGRDALFLHHRLI